MREAARRSVLVVGVAAAAVVLWAVPQGAAARGVWSGLPSSMIATTPDPTPGTTPDPTPDPTLEPEAPDSTPPESTTESTTESTEPEDSTSDTSLDDALVGAGDPDSEIDTTTAAIAVVGFIALIGLASWWMVRRSDPDAAPMPPQPPSDLI
jgi:hypothetical protein